MRDITKIHVFSMSITARMMMHDTRCLIEAQALALKNGSAESYKHYRELIARFSRLYPTTDMLRVSELVDRYAPTWVEQGSCATVRRRVRLVAAMKRMRSSVARMKSAAVKLPASVSL